ncbi:MAG: ABC transporter ATP-binding protein [Lysobacteraceae bacterium]|nr:MAG: ABC transporter ATP-binding protein [Xanthomonadaceae bacterium]
MIETQSLSKHYGSLTAVDDLSFSVGSGEVLGFLGPNGAGKSTTMKMIAGFLTPTSGTASVCGYDVVDDALKAKQCTGYLPEGAPAYAEMTPKQFLNFVADVRGLQGDLRRQRLSEVHERLHLGKVWDRPIETLSKGFKRRVGLAQAILHDPKVLILDEPTDGLDPNQKHEVRSLISDMSQDKIIIVSTHILEEVHAVCNRAIIIAAGRILADDTPRALEARSRYHNAVRLRVAEQDKVAERLKALTEVASVEQDEDGALVALPANNSLPYPAIAALIAEKGWQVDELAVESGRLDEVFRTITNVAGSRT